MEINKVTLNGVEYAISDIEARQVAAILSNRVNGVETATTRLDTEVAELRAEQLKIREDIFNTAINWRDIK